MRLFPAYAGVILEDPFTVRAIYAFPRIRRGDPSRKVRTVEKNGFSPHTQG